jgi:DNA-3-methyladenine glycosylase II
MALSKDLAGALPAPADTDTDAAPYVPPYWAEAKAELMRRDRIMNKLIPQFGDLHLRGHPDPFTTLARSIVGQQVTVKAAEAAWGKLRACVRR